MYNRYTLGRPQEPDPGENPLPNAPDIPPGRDVFPLQTTSIAAAASTSRKTSRAPPSAPGVPAQRIMSGIPQNQLMTFSIEPSPTPMSATAATPLETEPALHSLSRNPSIGSSTSKWRFNEPTERVVKPHRSHISKQAVPSGSSSRLRRQSAEMNPPQPIESIHSYENQLLEAFSMPNPPLNALGSPHSGQFMPTTPQSASSSTLFDPNSSFGITPTPDTSFQDDEFDASGSHGSHFRIESDSDTSHVPPPMIAIGRSRKQRLSRGHVFHSALKTLSDSKLTVLDLLEATASGSEVEISTFHDKFYTDGNRDRLERVLDLLWTGPYKHMMGPWMDKNALEHVQSIVSKEIEAAKPSLQMEVGDITPEYVDKWNLNEIMDPITQNITPTWSKVLHAATQPIRKDGSGEAARDRPTARNLITAQVVHLRSQASSMIQMGLGLLSWSTGASRKMIEVLSRASLSMSFPSMGNILETVGSGVVKEAGTVARGPHSFTYDNINISTSIFVEQTSNMPSKVQSGTFPMIYRLHNATDNDTKLAPILENFEKSKPLTTSALRPSREAALSYHRNTTINIIHILCHHVNGLEFVWKDPKLRHLSRRPLPPDLLTKFYPLRTTTIDEATVQGNISVHQNAYETQMQFTREELQALAARAVLSINDQLTNARIRGAQKSRNRDIDAYEQRKFLQLAPGLFHLDMNLGWGLLASHKGSIHQPGSLSYFFSALEKKRLNSEKPDYHTMMAALAQVLDGLILNAWRLEVPDGDLEAYVLSKPSADMLLEKANTILAKYCTPSETQEPKEGADNKSSLSSTSTTQSATAAPSASPKVDIVFRNTTLLIHDLLYIAELHAATCVGDFGRIEDILPSIACLFRGAGSNNYSMEVLHLIHNLKEVWPQAFANIVRDNMLVNPTGRAGHFMPVDLNIEHHIGYLKALFLAKGVYSNFERLGNISASIVLLQAMKRNTFKSLHTSYQGSTHSGPDTRSLAWKVANSSRDLKLQLNIPNRAGSQTFVPVKNLISEGYTKFEATSLSAFNKKLDDMKNGRVTTLEDDEIPPVRLEVEEDL